MKKLNQKSLDFIDDTIYKHKDEKGPTKLILHEIQRDLGYIPFEAMERMSEVLQIPISKIYGVVTFYSQFTTEPKGNHVISVCLGTACYVNGSQTILDLLVEMTGAPVNGTSADGILYGTVNSVMTGKKTVDQWYDAVIKAVQKYDK